MLIVVSIILMIVTVYCTTPFLKPTNMQSGRLQLSGTTAILNTVHNYAVPFDQTFTNPQIMWGLANMDINWSTRIKILNQIQNKTISGFDVRLRQTQGQITNTYIYYLVQEANPYILVNDQQISTTDLQLGTVKQQQHNITISSNPLIQMQCYVFLHGFYMESSVGQCQLQLSCQSIASLNRVTVKIRAGTNTLVEEVQLGIVLFDNVYYQYYTDTSLIYSQISQQTNIIQIKDNTNYFYGLHYINFHQIASLQLSQLSTTITYANTDNSTIYRSYFIQLSQPQCTSSTLFFNRIDQICYSSDFGCPAEGSQVQVISIDGGRIVDNNIIININNQTYFIPQRETVTTLNNINQYIINIPNATVTLNNILALSPSFMVYQGQIYSKNNTQFTPIFTIDNSSGLWKIQGNMVVNINDNNMSVYSITDNTNVVQYEYDISSITNNTFVNQTQLINIIKGTSAYIILISSNQIYKIQILSNWEIGLVQQTSTYFTYSHIQSNNYETITFITGNNQLIIYNQLTQMQNMSSPTQYLTLSQQPLISISQDASLMLIYDSLLLQVFQNIDNQYLITNIIQLTTQPASLSMNTQGNQLILLTDQNISIYTCQWIPIEEISSNSTQNQTNTQQQVQQVLFSETTLLIVLLSLFVCLVVGVVLYVYHTSYKIPQTKIKPEGQTQAKPQNQTKKSFTTESRDLAKKNNIDPLVYFKGNLRFEKKSESTVHLKKDNSSNNIIIEQIQ